MNDILRNYLGFNLRMLSGFISIMHHIV